MTTSAMAVAALLKRGATRTNFADHPRLDVAKETVTSGVARPKRGEAKEIDVALRCLASGLAPLRVIVATESAAIGAGLRCLVEVPCRQTGPNVTGLTKTGRMSNVGETTVPSGVARRKRAVETANFAAHRCLVSALVLREV